MATNDRIDQFKADVAELRLKTGAANRTQAAIYAANHQLL